MSEASTSTEAFAQGDEQEIEYHPLARDPQGRGMWGLIDRSGEAVAGWLNPILIKEARQALKSRQFIATFFLLLVASCAWTVLGVVSNAPDVYYLPTGDSLLVGYYFILAIPLIGMVPLAAHRSLAAEVDDDTFEMLVITKLSAMRIVMGKLNSAMLQMMVYFAALVPCLAFSYLLRGVTLPTIAFLIGTIFFTALLLTAFALMVATLAPNRAGQTLALLAVLAVIVFAEFTCAGFCLDVVLRDRMGDLDEAIVIMAAFGLMGASSMVLFVRAAAARIAPVTENRSSALRWTMFFQQLLWIACVTFLCLWFDDADPLNGCNMILGIYWLWMGTLMLSESPELSPRVQRTLPSTFAGRSLWLWFNPGPGTGFVFAIVTGVTGIAGLGVFGSVVGGRNGQTDPVVFAMIAAGYLMAYLGITRLIVLLLARQLGRSLILPAATMTAVLVIAAFTPMVVSVLLSGSPPDQYLPFEAIDWAWTLVEALEDPYPGWLAFMILATGFVLVAINLLLMSKEIVYRRIAVPQRVLAEEDSAV